MEWSGQKGSGEVFLKHLMNFYFRIILDLQKNCKNIRQSSCTELPLSLTLLWHLYYS